MRNFFQNGWFSFLFFIFIIGVWGSSIFPIVVFIGIVVAIATAISRASNKQTDNAYQRGYQRAQRYRRTTYQKPTLSPSDAAKINIYLRRYFRTTRELAIGTSLALRLHGSTFASLSSLDVYRDDTYICSFDDFSHRFPDSFREVLNKLIDLASRQEAGDVIDAEVSETPQPQSQPQPEEAPLEKDAQYYIDTINTLNSNIPDEEITNSLYQTTSLLKQIQALELKFPKSRGKLSKLYDYYLPILIRVLKQFENLQDANTDENYAAVKAKLTKTIRLINDAMKTIISSMTDADMMNLSADLSTLEALLQKDGLTGDQLKAEQTKEEGESHE